MADARAQPTGYLRAMSSAATTMITLARRTQEWLRSRPRFVDALVAVLVLVLAVSDLADETVTTGTRAADWVGYLLVVAAAATLVARRVSPVAVFSAVVGLSVVFYVRDYGTLMAAVGLAAIYAVAAHEEDRRLAWSVLGVGVVVLFAVASVTVFDGADGYRWSNALSMVSAAAAAGLAGAVVRNKEEIFADTVDRAERAEADRQAEAERAVTEERLRIAREMHDVVAHGMSLITVQAAAAREVAHTRPDDASRLMQSVEDSGRDALAEMRRMLGVLRKDDLAAPDVQRGQLEPQPSLADLDSTVDACIQAGIPAELVVRGDRRPLPPGIELAAFRIAQEALTNVVKHGGPGATVNVELTYQPDRLRIAITDTGVGETGSPPRFDGGHGLIGMRERVEIYGGHLVAGPASGGGFLVDASLPVGARSESTAALPEPTDVGGSETP